MIAPSASHPGERCYGTREAVQTASDQGERVTLPVD